jgi:hypothetical protein
MRGISKLIEPPQLGIDRKPGLRFVRLDRAAIIGSLGAAIGSLSFTQYPATEILASFEEVDETLAILAGRYDFPREQNEPHIRTVLDLAPGSGAFAAWLYSRFPYAWVDMIQPDEDKAKMCAINGPPGSTCRTIELAAFYEEVRALVDAKRSELAAAMGDIKVKVPGIAVDAVHFEAESADVEADMILMPIDWAGVKLVFVDVRHGSRFAGAAHALDTRGFQPFAAGAKFQVWGRR